jgi:hypothetical protein
LLEDAFGHDIKGTCTTETVGSNCLNYKGNKVFFLGLAQAINPNLI